MCIMNRCLGVNTTTSSSLWLTSLSNQEGDFVNLFDLRAANTGQQHQEYHTQEAQDRDQNSREEEEEGEYLKRKLFLRFVKWLSPDEGRSCSGVWYALRVVAGYLSRAMGMNEIARLEEQDEYETGGRLARQRVRVGEQLPQVIGGIAGFITTTNPAHLDFIIRNEQMKLRLLEILRNSRQFNIKLFVCHLALITGTIQQKYLETKSLSTNEIETRHLLWYSAIIIVSLLDFINNLQWRHARQSFVVLEGPDEKLRFKEVKSSWFKSLFLLLVSPGHLLQLGYVFLIINMPTSLTSTGDLIVVVYNSLNQMLRNLYNGHRTHRYMNHIEHHGALQRLPRRNEDNNIGNDDRNTTSITSRQHQRGWSNWPIRLWSGEFNFQNSFSYHFEWLQMLLQMFGVKLTIFRLLLQLDGLDPTQSSRSSHLLLLCLLQAFLAMHFHYDKFYSRYMNKQRNTC